MSAVEQKKFTPVCVALFMRENRGLDFGGWMDAYARFMPVDAEFLLLANDSVYAPIGEFPEFFKKLISVEADFYGAIESLEQKPHLQSWFVLLRSNAYLSDAFHEIMTTPIPADMPKREIIGRYEIGLTSRLNSAGFNHHAFYSPRRSGWLARNRPFNASHMLWRKLVEDGMPFIKIDLLRDNPIRMNDIDQWQDVVATYAPAMVSIIAKDIDRRRTFTNNERWWGEYWYWSIHESQAVYWPETRRIVGRDHNSHAGFHTTIDRVLFYLIEFVGSRLRQRVKLFIDAKVEKRRLEHLGGSV